MTRAALLVLLAAACAAPAAAASAPDFLVSESILRYYDASNAISASQLLGVPMPLKRGKAGDWALSLAPAYIHVSADPLKLNGASLNVGYSRLLGKGWGVYAVALTNYARTSATSDAGEPNERLLPFVFCLPSSGGGYCDSQAAYSGAQAAGGTIVTFAESFGAAYTLGRDSKFPVTVFGGPVFTQSYARGLTNSFSYTGTYYNGSSGGHPYTLSGTAKNSLNAYFTGVVLGASAEYDLGAHFRIAPHIYEVWLPSSSQDGTVDVTEVLACGDPGCGTTTRHREISSPIGAVYFPIPGCDLIYRDWRLSFNLIEPFGGLIARTTAEGFLHGAWPFSLRLTRTFGRYEK